MDIGFELRYIVRVPKGQSTGKFKDESVCRMEGFLVVIPAVCIIRLRKGLFVGAVDGPYVGWNQGSPVES